MPFSATKNFFFLQICLNIAFFLILAATIGIPHKQLEDDPQMFIENPEICSVSLNVVFIYLFTYLLLNLYLDTWTQKHWT